MSGRCEAAASLTAMPATLGNGALTCPSCLSPAQRTALLFGSKLSTDADPHMGPRARLIVMLTCSQTEERNLSLVQVEGPCLHRYRCSLCLARISSHLIVALEGQLPHLVFRKLTSYLLVHFNKNFRIVYTNFAHTTPQCNISDSESCVWGSGWDDKLSRVPTCVHLRPSCDDLLRT